MQAKRISLGVASLLGGAQTGSTLVVPDDPREEVNFHNIWISMCAEPLVADANAQGTWVLWCIRSGQAEVIFTDVNIQDETFNNHIVALGVWCASNQTPYNLEKQIRTSRNCGPGDQFALRFFVAGVTTGSVLVRTLLSAHVIRK